MIPAIASLLLKLGLSKATADKAAPIVLVVAALAALASLATAFGIWLHVHDRGVIENHVTKANNTTLRTTITANETAAGEQLRDQRDLSDVKRSYDDAIHNPRPGASADARVRFNCERLRRQGHRDTDLPEVCRHAGRGDAGADRAR